MRQRRRERVLRAVLAASVATFTALCSHVLAGGAAPSVAGVLLPLAVALPLSLAIVGRRPSLPRMGAVVAVSQIAFHATFVLATPGGTLGGHSSHLGHGAGPLVVQGPDAASALAHSLTAPMLLGHLAAAVVTVAALYRLDVVCRVLAELAAGVRLRLRFLVAARGVPPLPAPRLRPIRAVTPRRWVGLPFAVPSRRGPPLAA